MTRRARRRLLGWAVLLLVAVAVIYGAGAVLATQAPAAAHAEAPPAGVEPADPAPTDAHGGAHATDAAAPDHAGADAAAGHLADGVQRPDSEAASAHGAGTHQGADAGEHGGSHDTFLGLPRPLWLTANLLAFFGALLYLLVPPINRFLDARGEEIRRNLELAAQQERESSGMRDSLAARVHALEQELNELVARARSEGERERAELLAQAERERARLFAQTREEIAHRLAQARAELTAHTAALAADLARERVARAITPEDRRRLFDENLRRLDRIAAGGAREARS